MTLLDVRIWTDVCAFDDLQPGRGACALVDEFQVALFRLADDSLYALSNYDPFSDAYVISRGLVGSKGDTPKVASPVYKQSFDLRTGATHEEHIRDDHTEFGIINPAVAGKEHRYVHAATGKPGWFLFDGLVRHDVRTGDDQHLRLPDGVYCSEVGVAPKVGGTAEDDAYLVTLTTDVANDTSECWVLDASDITAGPVAKLRLPQRISSGTHATWAPGSAVPGW
jgi:NAD(P)H-dependent nitrite reductase small subunit